MYNLDIDNNGTPLVQGMVRAEWPAHVDLRSGAAAAWLRMYVRSAALWSQVKLKSAAVRIALEPGATVTTLHSFVVDKCEEPRLRLLLAAFLRTEGLGAGHAEVPQKGMVLEGMYFHPSEPRIGLRSDTLTTEGGHAIYPAAFLADLLPKLLVAFADLGIAFAYEFQATPWSVPREPLRAALINASRMADTAGIPTELAAAQMALGERARRATFHVEECIAAPRPEALAALGETLANVLAGTLYGRYGAEPKVAPLEPALTEAFATHVHSHLVLGVPVDKGTEVVTAAATREDVDRCLSCREFGLNQGPSGSELAPEPLAAQLAAATPPRWTGGAWGHTPASRVPSPDGIAPSLFVSYARHDSDQVYPLSDALSRAGINMWIDRRLIGGDDWIAELEQQLTACRGVLAFVSPAFVASRYCRREVSFADALNKTIIPVVLSPAAFTGGLNFILHSVQQIPATHGVDTALIIAAVRAMTPEAMHGG